MIKFWVYLNSDTFVWVEEDSFLVFNTITRESILGNCDGYLKEILCSLSNVGSLYCIEVEERVCEDDSVRSFLTRLEMSTCGGYKISTNNHKDRPICLPPIPNIQSEISRRKENKTFCHISYLNHITIHYGMEVDQDVILNSLNEFIYRKPAISIEMTPTSSPTEQNNLISFLRELSTIEYTISLNLPYELFVKHTDFVVSAIPLIKTLYVKSGRWTKDMCLEIKNKYTGNFVIFADVKSEKEYERISQLQDSFSPDFPIVITPCYTGSNSSFVSSLISYKKEDVLLQEISKSGIFRHMLINTNFFGKLQLQNNGNIVSPSGRVVLSSIHKENCWEEASRLECERPASEWYMTRELHSELCSECTLKYLCPSPSLIEIISGCLPPCRL